MELNYMIFLKSRPKIGQLSIYMRYVCDIFMVVLLVMLRVIFLTYLYDYCKIITYKVGFPENYLK